MYGPNQTFAAIERVDNGFIVRYQEIFRRPIEKDARKTVAAKKVAGMFSKLVGENLPGEGTKEAIEGLIGASAGFDQGPTERVAIENRSVFCQNLEQVMTVFRLAAVAYEAILESRRNGENTGYYGDDCGLQTLMPR